MLSQQDCNRFWNKVEKDGPGGCWIWSSATNTFGYGKFDIPARGAVDVLGAFSLSFYKLVSAKRAKLAQTYPNEASGFEIVAQKI